MYINHKSEDFKRFWIYLKTLQGKGWTVPSQFGKLWNSSTHWVHLSPTICSLQVHFPLASSQLASTDPSSLQWHSIRIILFKVISYEPNLLAFDQCFDYKWSSVHWSSIGKRPKIVHSMMIHHSFVKMNVTLRIWKVKVSWYRFITMITSNEIGFTSTFSSGNITNESCRAFIITLAF